MRRRRWLTALFLACILLTFLTGIVVGYVSVWLQFFGASPDRQDYLMGAAGYGAAAVVLLLSLPALLRLRVRPWIWGLTGGLLVVLALAGLVAAGEGWSMPADPNPYSHWSDGAGGVIACPWTWPLVVLGLMALLGRGPLSAVPDSR